MKKVLLVTEMFPPRIGGAENYYYNLCKNLPSDKIVVLADISLLDHGQPAKAGFKIIYSQFFYKENIWPKWLKLFFNLQKIITQEKPDLLWAGEVLPAGVVVRLVARMYSLPYIVSTHGADVLNPQLRQGLSSKRRLCLLKKVLQGAKLIITNSEYTRLIVSKLGIKREKSIVVYPAPNITPKIKKIKNQKITENIKTIKNLRQNGYKIVLTVARQERRKGVDMVLQAMTRVWLDQPKVAYVVVGAGPYLEKLKAISKAVDHFVDNRPRVYFTEYVSDDELNYIYSLADVFIMVPREERGLIEGFGSTYLEAGLHSLPVIGSKVGGVPEAIVELYDGNSDAATGVLVNNPKNSNEIAKKILMLIKDEGIAKKLGENGKAWLTRFKWVEQARKIENKLEDVSKLTTFNK